MFNLICLNAEGVSILQDRYDDEQDAVIRGQRFLSENDSRLVRSAYVVEHEISLTSAGLVSVLLQHRWFGTREEEPKKEEPKKVYMMVSVDKRTGGSFIDGVTRNEKEAIEWAAIASAQYLKNYIERSLGED